MPTPGSLEVADSNIRIPIASSLDLIGANGTMWLVGEGVMWFFQHSD
jgi:hypothetical protein